MGEKEQKKGLRRSRSLSLSTPLTILLYLSVPRPKLKRTEGRVESNYSILLHAYLD